MISMINAGVRAGSAIGMMPEPQKEGAKDCEQPPRMPLPTTTGDLSPQVSENAIWEFRRVQRASTLAEAQKGVLFFQVYVRSMPTSEYFICQCIL